MKYQQNSLDDEIGDRKTVGENIESLSATKDGQFREKKSSILEFS